MHYTTFLTTTALLAGGAIATNHEQMYGQYGAPAEGQYEAPAYTPPMHEVSTPAYEAAPVHVSTPVYEAPPMHVSTPMYEAPPVHETMPAYEQPPMHETTSVYVPPVHETMPPYEAPPVHETMPPYEIPPVHETTPVYVAPTMTHSVAPVQTYVQPAPSHVAPEGGAGQVVHVVQVSDAGASLIFTPKNTIANVGDFVQFQFWPKNHSVVQSAFDSPCVPLQNVQPNATQAFFSGFMPVTVDSTETPTYTIQVHDMKPIWYYCSQAMHCQNGMVGAINAPLTGEKTIEKYTELAGGAPQNLSPGHNAPGGNYSVSVPSPSASPIDTTLLTSAIPLPPVTSIVVDGGATPTQSGPLQVSTAAAPGLLVEGSLSMGLAGLAAFLLF